MTLDVQDYAALIAELANPTAGEGGDVAIVDARGTQTRTELAERVRRLASGLAEQGVRTGDVVALWLPNRREWVETALAVGALGAITLGVNTKLRSHDVQTLLQQSRASVLVVDTSFKGIDFAGMLASLRAQTANLRLVVDTADYSELVASEPMALDSSLDPLRPAQAFSSSGSTGTPKLVLHSPHGLLFHAAANATAYGINEANSVILVSLPLCGVFGFDAALAGLTSGRTVVLQEVFDAHHAADLISQHGVTHLSASDTLLERLCDAVDAKPSGAASTWTQAAFGKFTPGDAAPLVARGDAAGRYFFQTYGSSEVLSTLTFPTPDADPARRALGGGASISPQVIIDVRDSEGASVPVGSEGEIWVGGPTVCLGYLRDGVVQPPALSPDGLLATGDFGVRRSETDVIYLGRLGDAIRIGGFLFSPAEVESYLDGLDGVARSAYVAVEHDGSLRTVAFVKPTGTSVDLDALAEQARSELAPFKVPLAWRALEDLPVISGANGDKIDKKSLIALAHETLAAKSTQGVRP